jgi:NAD(P)-dependent dehydrogenase (short-subunit alcohol dehydrogenase family)
MEKKANQVWFITGCSTGFGRELATLLLSQGYKVVITARDPERVKDIGEGYPDTSLIAALDVTSKLQISEAVRKAEEKFGRIDVLVNNAGYGYFTSIEEGEDDKIRAQFETNFFGLVDMTKAVLPGMRSRRHGSIVNFSSIGGLRSFMATGYYHATKYALEGWSESLSQEVASLGIKVLIVEPGPFRTDWAGRSTSRTEPRITDYQSTVGARMKASLEGSGKQKGDPIRGSQAIIDAVESGAPHLRLLLGKMALDLANEKLNQLKDNFNAYETLTLGADYPEGQ